MNPERNGGYSLIEILIAIVLLGAIMVPTCTCLVMSVKLNDRTDEMMQAQLAVSSAVETLMAEGISGVIAADRFPGVTITVETVPVGESGTAPYYEVIVSDDSGLASVTTYIRAGGGGG